MSEEGGGFKVVIGVVIILVITAVLVGVVVRYYQQETAETTHVIRLTIDISDGEDDPIWDRLDPTTKTYMPYISNISTDASIEFDELNVLDAPKNDAPLASNFPIVWVYKVEDETGEQVGYRNSVSYTGPGSYELVLSLDEEPQSGDHINIYFKIVDQRLVVDNEGHSDYQEFQMFPLFDNGFDFPNSIIQYDVE